MRLGFFNFWDAGKFYCFLLEKFIFLENPFIDFQKSGIHRMAAYILVCLHAPLVSFGGTLFPQLSKKPVGEYLIDFFCLTYQIWHFDFDE